MPAALLEREPQAQRAPQADLSAAPRMAILLNPDAGTVQKTRHMLMELRDQHVGRLMIHEIPDMGLIPEALATIREFNPNIIGIAGGDGTAHQILNAYLQRYGFEGMPFIFLLGGGSSNCAAINFIPRKRIPDVARRLFRARSLEQVVTQPKSMIRVNGRNYGFIAVTGYGARVIQSFRENCPDRTPPSIARFGVRVIADAFTPWKIGEKSLIEHFVGTATFDGVVHPKRDWLHILAGVVNGLPVGLQFFRGVEEDSDHFKLSAGNMRWDEVGWDFWKFVWRKEFHDPRHVEVFLRRATFEFTEPAPLTLDGEAVQMYETVDLAVTPEKIQFIKDVLA